MKRMIALLLALVLCLSLIACDSGPDRQPAIDSYNRVSQTYNEFVELANQDLSGWTQEDIDFFNEIADFLNENCAKLESSEELTQEELDEMVEMFDEFDGVMKEVIAEIGG